MILGIDEAGRGPWAGPLVVGAVVLGDANIEGLDDSKKLTKKRRELLAAVIHEQAASVGIGWVSANEIDELGLSEALRLATRRAVEQINTSFHEIIIDGTINFLTGTPLEGHVTTLAKADSLIASVSAASIVAKVARDEYMAKEDSVYPGYEFSSHSGYGTAKHRAAIKTLGVTPLHRLSFAPLQKYRTGSPVQDATKGDETTKQIGDRAETVVANYLQANGHEIIERNWKTKWCEIDIISKKDNTIYFTEVKYRKDNQQGGGVAAITPKKLQQMKFAAEVFMMRDRLNGAKLAVAEVTGSSYALTLFEEINE